MEPVQGTAYRLAALKFLRSENNDRFRDDQYTWIGHHWRLGVNTCSCYFPLVNHEKVAARRKGNSVVGVIQHGFSFTRWNRFNDGAHIRLGRKFDRSWTNIRVVPSDVGGQIVTEYRTTTCSRKPPFPTNWCHGNERHLALREPKPLENSTRTSPPTVTPHSQRVPGFFRLHRFPLVLHA